MKTKLSFWQAGKMTDVERDNFATFVAQAVLDALRRGRTITIDVEDKPHPEAVAEGADPPLSIDEVRRIMSDAADAHECGRPRFVLKPESVVRLCDAIERGYTVPCQGGKWARPVMDPQPAHTCAPPYVRNERCVTEPVFELAPGDACDRQDDAAVAGLAGDCTKSPTATVMLRICRRLISRRDYWRLAARKWEKAWVSAAREINRLNVAAQDKDAELALLRRGSDARPRLVDELPAIPPVNRARVEAMRRGGADCTLRYIGADVQRCTSRSGNAGAARWWLAIDRDTLIALCDGWLRGKSPSLAEKDAEIRRLSDALAKSADEIMCGDAGTIRRLQATVCDLMNSCGIAEAEVKRLTGSLADARKEVLAGGVTKDVSSMHVEFRNPLYVRANLMLRTTTAGEIPADAKFVTFWREDPRKAASQ